MADRITVAAGYEDARFPMEILEVRFQAAMRDGTDLTSWAETFQEWANRWQAMADAVAPAKLEEAA